MINIKKWENIFGFKNRKPEENIKQYHCDLALAIQIVTEDIVLKMAKEAVKITKTKNLCMAGGVALNCVANGKLVNQSFIEKLYVQPASGDAGGSLGAALAANYIYYKNEREIVQNRDSMKGTYLGPSYSSKEILSMNKKVKAVFKEFDKPNKVSKYIAEKIAEGNVIGWFQGRMEFGPRALGSRSILADARNRGMQKNLILRLNIEKVLGLLLLLSFQKNIKTTLI